MMSKHKTIAEALQYVADHPQPSTSITIDMPVWELVSRKVFDVANHPDKRVRGSMSRATRAQRLIYDRLVGRRRPGTHPAQVKTDEIDFVDLTVGVLGAATEPQPEEVSDDVD